MYVLYVRKCVLDYSHVCMYVCMYVCMHVCIYKGELHLRVWINNTDYIWLCGSRKDSHKHSTVYVDLNIPESSNMVSTTHKAMQYLKSLPHTTLHTYIHTVI